MNALVELKPRREDCLSDLALYRLLDGETDAALQSHLAGCLECEARREGLVRSRAALQGSPYLSAAARAVEEAVAADRSRATARPHRPRALLGAAGALAAAAALAVAVIARVPGPADSERTKGLALSLTVHVRHSDGIGRPLEAGQPLAAGAALRFELKSRHRGFAAVLGLDRRGTASAYAPTSGAAVEVSAGAAHLFAGSQILDDAPGPELVAAVLCEHPFEVEALVSAGRAALQHNTNDLSRVGPLMPGCMQATVLLEKVTP